MQKHLATTNRSYKLLQAAGKFPIFRMDDRGLLCGVALSPLLIGQSVGCCNESAEGVHVLCMHHCPSDQPPRSPFMQYRLTLREAANGQAHSDRVPSALRLQRPHRTLQGSARAACRPPRALATPVQAWRHRRLADGCVRRRKSVVSVTASA
jgi:hypothetical protein